MERQIEFQNNLEEVARITAFIETVGEELNLAFPLVSSLQLAIEEAVVNVINYAYAPGQVGQGQLSVTLADNLLTFTLSDSGTPFDPTAKADPDLTLSVQDRPIGGLGILLIKKIMDSVTYQYVQGQNQLIMTKTI